MRLSACHRSLTGKWDLHPLLGGEACLRCPPPSTPSGRVHSAAHSSQSPQLLSTAMRHVDYAVVSRGLASRLQRTNLHRNGILSGAVAALAQLSTDERLLDGCPLGFLPQDSEQLHSDIGKAKDSALRDVVQLNLERVEQGRTSHWHKKPPQLLRWRSEYSFEFWLS